MSKSSSCRLCLEELRECIPLTEKQGAEMLEALTAIKVTHNEKVSTSICPGCFLDLKTAFDLQQKILKAELRHHDELLADFLIENHDELMKLVQREMGQMQVEDVGTTKAFNKLPLISDVEESPVKHTCGLCFDKFQLSSKFVEHLQQHILHSKKLLVKCDILCELCGDILPTSEAYDEHKNTVHPSFVCNTCLATFISSSMLEEHIKEKHTNPKQFVCDICNERFALRYIMQVHKVQHSIKYPFVCEVCGRSFRYNVSLEVHQRMKHSVLVTPSNQFFVPVKKQLFN